MRLEDVWPSRALAGVKLVWAESERWARTRAAQGGLAAEPGGLLEPLSPRPAEPMLPAAVLSTNHAVLTNRGGVTLANGCQLQGAALATSVDVAALRFFPTSRVEDCDVSEAVLLAQPGDQVFGHQLLDLIPRVLTARRILSSSVPFLISWVAADSFSALLAQFGLRDASLLPLPPDPNTAVHVGQLYLVTGARQDYKLDGERLQEMLDSMPRASDTTFRGDLFLSRAHLAEPQIGNRPLLNRADVERSFQREGYRLVYPEEHSFAEMGQLVQGTRYLAGEDGSALHNVLWRPRRLVCLGHAQSAVNLHLRLCDALGVEYVYLGGETATFAQETSFYPRDRSWSVSAPWLDEVLREVQELDTVSAAASRSPTRPVSASHVTACFWGVDNRDIFSDALERLLRKHFGAEASIFAGDNLITIGRMLSPLFDHDFMEAFRSVIADENYVGQGIIWRLYTLAWAARSCLRRDGDFVECGVSTGTSSKIMCEYLRFEMVPKRLFLVDVFGQHEKLDTAAYFGEKRSVLDEVHRRFGAYPNAMVTPGYIPDVLDELDLDQISFLHIDLNNVEAEIAALDRLFELVVPGGLILLNGYGDFAAQKSSQDAWMEMRGYAVLELPTGQGLVVK